MAVECTITNDRAALKRGSPGLPGRMAGQPSLRAIWAMRSGSGGRSSVPDRVTVKAVDGMPDELLNGLPGETARLLGAAPVTDKRLLELSVTWTGLSRGRARMAAALRVFVITHLGSARVPGTPALRVRRRQRWLAWPRDRGLPALLAAG